MLFLLAVLRMASLLLLSPPKEVSAIRSLTMKGLHAHGLCRACYRRPASSSRTSSRTYLVPAPSCCPSPAMLLLLFPCAFAPDRWTQFLLLSIFSIACLPFPITPVHNSVCSPLPSSHLLTFVINWSDQHLDHCFLISHRVYIYQRTSSPSYKLKQDIVIRVLKKVKLSLTQISPDF